MKIEEKLTFDDVLLEPKFSNVNSRSQVDVSVDLKGFKFSHPIIPANMKSIIDLEMADAIIKSNGLAILHRFDPIDQQMNTVKYFKSKLNNLAVSIGVKDIDKENVINFLKIGVQIMCIDIAHGDSQMCIDMIKYIRLQSKDVLLIAGNVATGAGAGRLWKAGADVVKVGVGSGSICLTRIEAAAGVPQLSAILSVAEKAESLKFYHESIDEKKEFKFISDGGIRNAGDCVKSLAIADMVMAGGLFAGCAETPGNIVIKNNISYKEHNGSSTHKESRIEGVKGLVPIKGTFNDILKTTIEGIQSGCSYQGAHNLKELKVEPSFIKITNAGVIESRAHDVIVQK